MPPFPTGVVIALAVVVGSGSLVLFAVFLFFGPLGLIDLGLSPRDVLILDATLCLAFCVQHSLMVRKTFRGRFEAVVPPHYHGAVFTLASAILLLGMVLLWQESPVVVVGLEGSSRWLVRAVFFAALPGFLWGARSIPKFDPFGVGPIKARLRGRNPRPWPFTVRGPYRWVRHPQYLFALVLVWAYPDLTLDRLLLDGVLTVWIVLGTILEERDLVEEFGDEYAAYRQHVPMLIPWRRPWKPR